jgi:WD40 repeat protein
MPFAALALSAVLTAAPVPAEPGDLFRDPLPPGAVCRVGTVRLRAPEWMSSLAFTPDGKLLVTAGHGPRLRVWDAATGLLVREVPLAREDDPDAAPGKGRPEQVIALAFPPGERRLFALTWVGNLRACDLTDGTWSEPLATAARKGEGGTAALFWRGRASADGTHFQCTTGDSVSGATEVLAVGKGGPVCRTDHKTHGWFDAVVVGDRLLGTGLKDGKANVWDLKAGKVVSTHAPPHGAWHDFTISPDGKTLVGVCGADEGDRHYVGDPAPAGTTLYGWDAATSKELFRNPGWESRRVAFSPDGKLLVAADAGVVLVADAATGKLVHRLRGHGGDSIDGYAFSPDGKRLATAGDDRAAIVWDLSTGKPVLDFDSPRGPVTVLAFSPDSKTLFAGSRDDHAGGLWDAATGRRLRRLAVEGRHKGSPLAAAFTPDGRRVAVGYDLVRAAGPDSAGGVRLWGTDGTLGREFPGHSSYVTQVAVSADGKELITADRYASRLRRWDLDTGKLTKEVGARVLFCLPKAGEAVGVGWGRDKQLIVADPFTGKAVGEWTPDPWAYPLALSPDGRVIALREEHPKRGDSLVLRRAATGEVVCRPDAGHIDGAHKGFCGMVPPEDPNPVAFSPDGRTVAVAGVAWREPNPVMLFDAATGEKLRTFRGHAGEVRSMAFSPDGKRLASGGADCTVLVWDLTGKP